MIAFNAILSRQFKKSQTANLPLALTLFAIEFYLKFTVMAHHDQFIHHLQSLIDHEKSMIKASIKNGHTFEEVKEMTLRVKELQKQLESYMNVESSNNEYYKDNFPVNNN